MISFKEFYFLSEDACKEKVKRRYKVWPSAYACVPVKTSKALTKTGWKSHSELTVGEEILTFNLKKDCLEFKPILNLHHYEDVDTWFVKNGNTGFKFECTPNHKWVVKYENKSNVSQLLTTEELLNTDHNIKLVTNSLYKEELPIISDKIYNEFVNSNECILSCENLELKETKKSDVWCPETENGTWVMMQETDGNGIITITGNSGALVRCRKVGAANWGNKKKKKK
jgi:hypothetical protein